MKLICDRALCTGCGLCVAVCPKKCINMILDDEGFYAPKINEQVCINCGACEKNCPVNSPVEKHQFQSMYAAYAHDSDIRKKSSSGGVATVLASAFVSVGGYIVGAKLSDNRILRHVLTKVPSEIQKSKYIQSYTADIYSDLARVLPDSEVLFFGTPCQVAAVKRMFAGKDANLYTCELLCHAAPSPGLFADYIDYLENKKGKIKSYDFRSKRNTWSNASAEIQYANGEIYCKRHLYDQFHSWFGKYLSVRNSCYNCPYRDQLRVGDITIGDFWGGDQILKDSNTAAGVSRVLINTAKGEQIISRFATGLEMIPVDAELVEKKYDKLFHLKVIKPTERDDFMRIYKDKGIKELIKRYPTSTPMKQVIRKIKRRLHLG